MSSSDRDIHALAMKIRYDLTSAQAKLTDLVDWIGQLNLNQPEPLTCPHCGPWHGSATQLAEHLYSVDPNRYPVPPHWQQAEARALDVVDVPDARGEAA